jgi:GNAT superfamily N-acetyltransferase
VDVEAPVLYQPATHDVSGFDCGSEAQTRWLRHIARTAQAAGTARVYVVTALAEDGVLGYHALAAASVMHDDAPPALLKSAGRSPVPVILLARLGVDLTAQGHGIGAALVKDAMLRAYQASHIVGARALVIHAESERARDFYLHLAEFDASPTDPLHLVVLMSEIERITTG